MNLWRTTIEQGGETYAWLKKLPGGTPLSASLGATALPLQSWVRYPQWYTPSVQTGFLIPASTPVGEYTLGSKTIKVVAPLAQRPVAVVKPGQSIQDKLTEGFDVHLGPGRHELPQRLNIPVGASVRGSGRDCTYLVRLPDGDYANRTIMPSSFVTVRDLTIVNVGRSGYAFNANSCENVTIERVRFQGGDFGEFLSPGLLVRDCLFDNCSARQINSNSLFHRCRFVDSDWGSWGSDSIALVDCDFERCSLVVSSHRGPITNGLYSGLHFSSVQGRDNGSEVFMAETADFRNNFVMGLRTRGGEGCGIQLYESHAVDNLFWDFVIEGGSTTGLAIWFQSTGQHTQTGNLFQCGELRGGRVDFGERATGNVLRNVGFVSPRPSRGNQLSWFRPEWYGPQAVLKAAPGTTNRAESCAFVDVLSGWHVADNVTII